MANRSPEPWCWQTVWQATLAARQAVALHLGEVLQAEGCQALPEASSHERCVAATHVLAMLAQRSEDMLREEEAQTHG